MDLLSILFEQRVIEHNSTLTDSTLSEKMLMKYKEYYEMERRKWKWWYLMGGLGLINAYKLTNNKVFLDMDYQWNGARGVK